MKIPMSGLLLLSFAQLGLCQAVPIEQTQTQGRADFLESLAAGLRSGFADGAKASTALIPGVACGPRLPPAAHLCPIPNDSTQEACTPYQFNGANGGRGDSGWGCGSFAGGDDGLTGEHAPGLVVTVRRAADDPKILEYKIETAGRPAVSGRLQSSDGRKMHVMARGGNGGMGGDGSLCMNDRYAWPGDGGHGGDGGNGAKVIFVCQDGPASGPCALLDAFVFHLEGGFGGSGGGAGWVRNDHRTIWGRDGDDGRGGRPGAVTVAR